nr:hypothetical protein [Syntrophorhabdus aromaticivorans]
MHDRKDENTCFFDGIEHTIGKPVCKAATNVVLYDRPSMRMCNNVLYCGKDLDREIVTESVFTILIVFNCCVEFFLCFRVEREGHFSKRL